MRQVYKHPINSRALALLLLVVFPGAVFTGMSTYYLFPAWVALDNSYQNYQKLAQTPTAPVRDLNVAQAVENWHYLNCFAEGVGGLLSGVITAIGIHGICTLPQPKP